MSAPKIKTISRIFIYFAVFASVVFIFAFLKAPQAQAVLAQTRCSWKGTTSRDWDTATNWTCSVAGVRPTGTTGTCGSSDTCYWVFIPSDGSNSPMVTSTVKNIMGITIGTSSTATLTITGGGSISLVNAGSVKGGSAGTVEVYTNGTLDLDGSGNGGSCLTTNEGAATSTTVGNGTITSTTTACTWIKGTGNVLTNKGTMSGKFSMGFSAASSGLTNTGTINLTAGTFTTSSTQTVTCSATRTSNKFFNFNAWGSSVTTTLAGNCYFGGYLKITTGDTLVSGTGVLELASSSVGISPFIRYGTFTASAGNTVLYSGTGNTTIATTTYRGLWLAPTSGAPTYTVGTAASQSLWASSSTLNSVILDLNTYNASTTVNGNFTADANSSVSAPASSLFKIGGNWLNSGTFTANNGTTTFATTTNVTINGSMIGASTFGHVEFGLGGTKTFSANASTTNFYLDSTSGLVTAPSLLSIAGSFINNDTFANNSGTIYFTGASQTHSGSMIGTSGATYGAFNNVIFMGSGAVLGANASTTDFTIVSGASVTAPTLLSIAGNYNNLGDFTGGSGTVYLTGSNKTLSGQMIGAADDFNNVIFSGTYAFSDNASTTSFTINTSASANITDRLITISGSYANSGDIATSTASKMYFDSTSAQTLSGNLTNSDTLPDLEFLGSGTKTFSANASTTNLTIQSGSGKVDFTGRLITLAGSYTNNDDAIGTSTATDFYFDSTSAQTLQGTLTNSATLPDLIFLGTGAKTFSNNASTTNLTITAGSGKVTFSGQLITMNGNFIASSTIATTTASKFYFTGSGSTLSGFMVGSSTLPDIQILSSGTVTLNANASTTNLTINQGKLDMSGRVVSLDGNYNNIGGTIATTTSSYLFFTGVNNALSGYMTASSTFPSVYFNGSGTASLSNNASTTDLTINSGSTLSAPSSGLISIAGNYTNNGAFTANSGTVYLSGSSQQTVSGNATGTSAFYNLTILNNSGSDPDSSPSVIFSDNASTTATFTAATPNVKIRFTAAKTYTLTNINLNGQADGTRVKLRSSSSGSYWYLIVSGTQSVSYVDVKDSNASLGSAISVGSGVYNSGHNVNWSFTWTILTQRNGIFENDEDATNISSPYASAKAGERLRVKIQIDTSSGPTSTNAFILQFDKDSDENWQRIRPAGEIRPALSSIIHGKQRLAGPDVATCQNGKTWNSGRGGDGDTSTTTWYSVAYEGTAKTGFISVAGDTCQEIAFVIETSNALSGVAYRFRLATTSVDNINSITYSAYPQLTISDVSTVYSKGIASSTFTTTSSMPYLLDNQAYSDVGASDNTYEAVSNTVLANGLYNATSSDSMTASTTDAWFLGNTVNELFGKSTASGDINGDGISDLIVGASGYSSNLGRTYVFYGSSAISASTTPANANVIITGEETSGYLGQSVSSGDINGDGYDDIIAGAYLDDADGNTTDDSLDKGRVFVVYGSSSLSGEILASSSANVIISGQEASGRLGQSVSSGDINGDGYSDIIAGAYLDDADGNTAADSSRDMGRVFVIYGSATLSTTSPISTGLGIMASSSASVIISGQEVNGQLGNSVSAADINGDGFVDIIAGASNDDADGNTASNSLDKGRVFVIYGSATLSTTSPISTGLGIMASSSASVIISGQEGSGYLGTSVSSGDINGDGYDDIIAGANLDDADGNTTADTSRNNGRVFVIYGFSTLSTTSPISTGLGIMASSSASVIISGQQADSQLGYSVSAADINGDGFVDIIAGAYHDDANGSTAGSGFDMGRVFVIYGSATLSTTSPISTGLGIMASSSASVIISGQEVNGQLGNSVSAADINGDGYPEIITGAYQTDANGYADSGAVFALFGGRNIDWQKNAGTGDILASSTARFINGGSWFQHLGNSVATGDINGNGIPDLIAGAYGYSAYLGRVYVYLDGKTATTTVGTTTPDIIITGQESVGYLGSSVSSGDINGDGYSDIIAGAYLDDADGNTTDAGATGNKGRVFVIFGSSSLSGEILASSSADVIISGQEAGGQLGYSVASADINGDGYDDIITGAYQDDADGNTTDESTDMGRTFVIYGSSSLSGEILASSSANVIISGQEATGKLGNSVTSGDINGDGYSDIITGAYQDDADGNTTDAGVLGNKGRAFVIYGSSSLSGEILASSSANIIISGEEASGRLGISVSSGDINGDGYSDIIAGADYDDADGNTANSNTDKGRIFVVYGSSSLSGEILASSSANIIISGEEASGYLGSSVSSGDINGDGYSDIIAGVNYDDADGNTTNEGSDKGRIFVVYGAKSPALPIYVFTKKNTDNTSDIALSWEGQSSVAPAWKTAYLDVYNFNTLLWENKATNNTAATSTDFTLSATIDTNNSNYYSPNSYWVFARVYQDLMYQTLKTDYFAITFTGANPPYLSRANHFVGPASNKFDIATTSTLYIDKGDIFRFGLSKSGGNVSVTQLVISLTGVKGISSGDITGADIYEDTNDNGQIDESETTSIGGSGSVSISGSSGSITFSQSFSVTAAKDYVLKARIDNLATGDEMTINLYPQNITSNSAASPSGYIGSSWHGKGIGGGGGSYIGGSPPAGQSQQQNGGNQGGEEIGSLPGFLAPASTGGTSPKYGEWQSGSSAYASDNSYATADSAGLKQDYYDFSFAVPGVNSITGIEVRIEASASGGAGGTIQINLSWDSANNFGETKATDSLTAADKVYVLGGSSDAWGHTPNWTPAEVNSTFDLRATSQPSANTVQIDAIQVKIYHQAGGGSPGGGGEI